MEKFKFNLNFKFFNKWVGNSRGNKYSRNHVLLDPSDEAFWKYSFHEMGIYDIPACLDYILKINKITKKVIYIGHSQGGTSILSGMSENYNYFKENLLLVVLLAPASKIDRFDSYFLDFLQKIDLDDEFKKHKINEVLPFNPDLIDLNLRLSKFYPTIFYAFLELTSDEVSSVNCPDRVKVYFSHSPSGTSRQSITHFKQIINSGKFQKFDFGKEENIKIYGKETQPEYDLDLIKEIPIILCGGLNDKITQIKDIRWLRDQLKKNNKIFFTYYEFEMMGHTSFMLNSNITWFNFVLQDIYKIMKMEGLIKENIISSKFNDNKSKQKDNDTDIYRNTDTNAIDNSHTYTPMPLNSEENIIKEIHLK